MNNDKPKRKEYVTKQQRNVFIRWYLNKYGYNIQSNLKEHNSRVLSEEYYTECGILIPKISIYRWLIKLKNNESKYTSNIDTFAHEFINPELISNKSESKNDENDSNNPISDKVIEGL